MTIKYNNKNNNTNNNNNRCSKNIQYKYYSNL